VAVIAGIPVFYVRGWTSEDARPENNGREKERDASQSPPGLLVFTRSQVLASEVSDTILFHDAVYTHAESLLVM
jgi:hypothetical protein